MTKMSIKRYEVVYRTPREHPRPDALRVQELLAEGCIGIHDAANLVALRSVARSTPLAPFNNSFSDHDTIRSPEYDQAVVRGLEAIGPGFREPALRDIGERLRVGEYP